MKIRSINCTNINRLRNASMDYSLENGVPFNEIGLEEVREELVLVFVANEQAKIFKFEKEPCIGHEPAFISENVIEPMLDHLKGKEY